MPSTRRSAAPGTVAAVLEDLRAIREDGGVLHADDNAFIATLAMLAPAQAITEDNRRMAENLILTYVRRVAVDARQVAGDDGCQMAASESFETIMARAKDETRKVASVRRAAQTKHGCHLSLDGLRKREDGLLDKLAVALHQDLQAKVDQRGPQTIEEMARYVINDVRDAFDVIDDGLRRVYSVAPIGNQQSDNSILLSMMYQIAHMQYWFGRIIGIRMRVQQHSRVDFLFADVAAVVMSQAFSLSGDRAVVNAMLTEVGRHNKRDFLARIVDDPRGQEIFRRFSHWASSCHRECAYQRTYNVGLLCGPHQFAFALYMFIDVHEDLLAGELEDDLKMELND